VKREKIIQENPALSTSKNLPRLIFSAMRLSYLLSQPKFRRKLRENIHATAT
jgi:hypothetical protein